MESNTKTKKGNSMSISNDQESYKYDDEGNETHFVRFVQKENYTSLSLVETCLTEDWRDSSNVDVWSTNADGDIILKVNQEVDIEDKTYKIASKIVVSPSDAKRLISSLAHCL
jgi:hypothetical protein